MPEEVKPTRRYRSTVRAEQAQRTRTRILDAAEQQFAQRGYAAAAIAAIARTADVAPDTVYATFKNKRGILGALVEARVRGAATPVLAQTGPQAVRAEPDQRRQIEIFVPDTTERLERVQTAYRVVAEAAASDPEVAALHKTMLDQRWAKPAAVRQMDRGQRTAPRRTQSRRRDRMRVDTDQRRGIPTTANRPRLEQNPLPTLDDQEPDPTTTFIAPLEHSSLVFDAARHSAAAQSAATFRLFGGGANRSAYPILGIVRHRPTTA